MHIDRSVCMPELTKTSGDSDSCNISVYNCAVARVAEAALKICTADFFASVVRCDPENTSRGCGIGPSLVEVGIEIGGSGATIVGADSGALGPISGSGGGVFDILD